MKKETLLLRMAITFLGVVVLLLSVFFLPWLTKTGTDAFPDPLIFAIVGGMVLTLPPFFFALFQALVLLKQIDAQEAFTQASKTAIKKIKNSAFMITGIYMLLLPVFYIIAELDDAPGVVVIGILLAGAPLIIAVFAAVLEKLLESALAIKSENDLTI